MMKRAPTRRAAWAKPCSGGAKRTWRPRSGTRLQGPTVRDRQRRTRAHPSKPRWRRTARAAPGQSLHRRCWARQGAAVACASTRA
jgi:hypothetical protein